MSIIRDITHPCDIHLCHCSFVRDMIAEKGGVGLDLKRSGQCSNGDAACVFIACNSIFRFNALFLLSLNHGEDTTIHLSLVTCGWVVVNMKDSCHIWMCLVAHMNGFCRPHIWNEWCHVWVSHNGKLKQSDSLMLVTNESYRTYERVV